MVKMEQLISAAVAKTCFIGIVLWQIIISFTCFISIGIEHFYFMDQLVTISRSDSSSSSSFHVEPSMT